ncbi:MAG: nitroreductase family protein [Chloroflexi bacterium]|nr:nitroreductase family protein [Chloroflexota bacterium]
MELFEAIAAQRAIRRYNPDPVPEEAIRKIIEAATRAPSGGNRQPWRFIIIRDPELKRKLGEYYKVGITRAYGNRVPAPPADETPAQRRRREASAWLTDHMGDVPVLIMVCAYNEDDPAATNLAQLGSSIYLAVQNLLLAATGLGLGTVITTLHKLCDAEVKELLGIPKEAETAALIPLGYPGNVSFGGSRRRPIEQVMFYDRWGTVKPSSA